MLKALRPALSGVLIPVGEALARTPITPNAITITGTAGVVAGALWLFPTGHLFAGTVVCTVFVLFDMLKRNGLQQSDYKIDCRFNKEGAGGAPELHWRSVREQPPRGRLVQGLEGHADGRCHLVQRPHPGSGDYLP